MEQPLQVAAYCRVSTGNHEQLGNLKTQIKYYTNYNLKQSNWTLTGIYSDNAAGVQLEKRVCYQQMMKDCKKRKIDLILVKSVSRFGKGGDANRLLLLYSV